MPNIYAYDYETFYSKTYSIRDLGNYAYTHHPEFDAYMLSVVGQASKEHPQGFEWVGNPKDFDWSILNGQIVIAHNAGFEHAVTERLREDGIVPADLKFAELYDTADLAAYLGVPRSLAAACLSLFGLKVDKGMRDKAKGQRWNDMSPEFQELMREYALTDAKLELKLWLEFEDQWPEWERELSKDTREMCWTGLPVDLDGTHEAISTLETLLWKVRTQIPWASDPETPALSKKLMAEECRKNKIEPPKSMAKDSEEFDAWLRRHGDALPFARAMGSYRSINMLLKKLIVLRDRTIIRGGNPVMPYALKYGGAHTLRDSGDAGFNPQNLSRGLMFVKEIKEYLDKDGGIDVRGLIMAPPGKVLAVADLTAIEPCALAVLANDLELVKNLAAGMDPYEAWARAQKGYTDPRPLKEVDPDLRQLCKVEILGLGYGAGAEKLVVIAKMLAGLVITLDRSEQIVADFRKRPFIPRLWRKLESDMRNSAPNDYTIELPSGRIMRYRDVRTIGGITAVIPRLGQMMRLKFWGGTLVENLVQACARDVFMHGMRNLKLTGLPPILRVHDEAVCLFDEATAEADLARMIKIMSTAPDWMPDLPVSAHGYLCKHYHKE